MLRPIEGISTRVLADNVVLGATDARGASIACPSKPVLGPVSVAVVDCTAAVKFCIIPTFPAIGRAAAALAGEAALGALLEAVEARLDKTVAARAGVDSVAGGVDVAGVAAVVELGIVCGLTSPGRARPATAGVDVAVSPAAPVASCALTGALLAAVEARFAITVAARVCAGAAGVVGAAVAVVDVAVVVIAELGVVRGFATPCRARPATAGAKAADNPAVPVASCALTGALLAAVEARLAITVAARVCAGAERRAELGIDAGFAAPDMARPASTGLAAADTAASLAPAAEIVAVVAAVLAVGVVAEVATVVAAVVVAAVVVAVVVVMVVAMVAVGVAAVVPNVLGVRPLVGIWASRSNALTCCAVLDICTCGTAPRGDWLSKKVGRGPALT